VEERTSAAELAATREAQCEKPVQKKIIADGKRGLAGGEKSGATTYREAPNRVKPTSAHRKCKDQKGQQREQRLAPKWPTNSPQTCKGGCTGGPITRSAGWTLHMPLFLGEYNDWRVQWAFFGLAEPVTFFCLDER
jgi:hypothetical protein